MLPTPVGKWKKWLLDAAKNIAVGVIQSLDYYEQIQIATETPPSEWRRVQLLFHDPNDPDTANTCVTTLDFVNITNGSVDNTWDDGDYATIEANLNTIMTGWGPQMATRFKWFESRYYRMVFNPLPPVGTELEDDKPFLQSGGPERVFAHNFSGSGGNPLPPQCAVTSTEITAYPRHWGRNYWPAPAASTVGSQGHIGSVAQNALATAVHDAYDALQAAEFFPVVPVTQFKDVSGVQPARALLSVNAIQVDDVFDVIRRRRTHTATTRVTLPL